MEGPEKNVFPELETPRLRLRQLRQDDAPALFGYFSKDEVTAYYDLESFTRVSEAETLIDLWQDRFRQKREPRWGIVLKADDTDKVIGTIGFHQWAAAHAKAETGYELAPPYWQQGLMTEALRAVTAYGFGPMKLNRIEALIDPANESSARLLAKCGFRREGVMEEYFFEKGRFVDAVMYAILSRNYV